MYVCVRVYEHHYTSVANQSPLQLAAAADAFPWDERESSAFWIGSCGSDYAATQARVVALKMRQGQLADFYLLNRCPAHQWLLAGSIDEAEAESIAAFPMHKMIDREDFARYKVLFYSLSTTLSCLIPTC